MELRTRYHRGSPRSPWRCPRENRPWTRGAPAQQQSWPPASLEGGAGGPPTPPRQNPRPCEA
eukprot:4031676-Lingulodinium_polyedra.AAC.1